MYKRMERRFVSINQGGGVVVSLRLAINVEILGLILGCAVDLLFLSFKTGGRTGNWAEPS